MPKKWLWCVAAIIVAAVAWNEYRLWRCRAELMSWSAPAQVDEPEIFSPGLVVAAKSDDGGEEQSEVTVIDLTWLQRQTAEPPVADTEEPTTLPLLPEPRHSVTRVAVPPRVADFERHSADGPSHFADLWKRIASFVWNVPLGEECEPLPVMPRLMSQPKTCPDSSTCPYFNGTGGQHYRR